MNKKENGTPRRKIDANNGVLVPAAFICVGTILLFLIIVPMCSDTRDMDPAWPSRRGKVPPPATPASPYPGTVRDRNDFLRTEVVVVNNFSGEGFAAVADPGGGRSLLVLCKKGTYSPNLKEGASIRIRGRVLKELFVGNSIVLILDKVGVVKDLIE